MPEVHSRILSNRKRHSVAAKRSASQNAATNTSFAPTTSLRLHVICVIATLIAAGIFTLTEHDDHRHTFWCAFEIIVQTLLVIVGMAFFRTRLKLLHDTSVVQPILLMVVTLTLLCEPFQRFFLEHARYTYE